MAEENKELTIAAQNTVIVASASDTVAAIKTYQQIQKALDESLEGSMMKIQGKDFRKKVYWRGVAVAFNLTLELVKEERQDIGNDWGYLVTYRATAANGRSADGDGACFASEKTDRDGNPTSMQTEHNVRSHAHTRAKNRAISDLVGFGEVSAEEMTFDHAQPPQGRKERDVTPKKATQASSGAKKAKDPSKPITDGQGKMLMAISYKVAKTMNLAAYDDEHELAGAIRKAAKDSLGIGDKDHPVMGAMDGLIAAMEAAKQDDLGAIWVQNATEVVEEPPMPEPPPGPNDQDLVF